MGLMGYTIVLLLCIAYFALYCFYVFKIHKPNSDRSIAVKILEVSMSVIMACCSLVLLLCVSRIGNIIIAEFK